MAYYRNARRYSRYPRKYSRYSPRATRRPAVRKATSNQRAARQQRDNATVTINRIFGTALTVPAQEGTTAVAISLWDEFRKSQYYNNYAPMFDQVCINKIRVKFTGQNAINAGTAYSPTMIMAFDRNGLDPSSTSIPNADLISTYSSAQIKQWSTGNAFAMYQTIYPTTIAEKGQYVPTTSLMQATGTADTPSNPCNLISYMGLPFKPVVLLATALPVVPATAVTLQLMCEIEYVVTFRGMRKPSIGGNVTAPSPAAPAVSAVRVGTGTPTLLTSFYASDGSNITLNAHSCAVQLKQVSATVTGVRVYFNPDDAPIGVSTVQQGRFAFLTGISQTTDAVDFVDAAGNVLFSCVNSGQDTPTPIAWYEFPASLVSIPLE